MGDAPPIERMANVIGHEIRNPLAVINNSIYFVKTKLGTAVDAKVGKHLGIIESEVQRANALIADMLVFARPVEVHPAPCSVAELLESALAARPPKPQVSVEVAPKDLRVSADAEIARGALRRLLDNACEAAGEGGAVAVRASRSGSSVDIVVRDSGPGVSADAQDKLFEPFFSTKPRGLGLGLATARKFAEKHGGALDRLPAPAGAAFRLRLPCA